MLPASQPLNQSSSATLQVYATMREKRCERNVITYGSLVNAADRAGRSKLALELYEDMHRDGCSPNLSTYTCLLHACAQGEHLSAAGDMPAGGVTFALRAEAACVSFWGCCLLAHRKCSQCIDKRQR